MAGPVRLVRRLVAVLGGLVALAGPGRGAEAPRSIVDLAGHAITLPDQVERVACLEVLCYQKMFMLGAADRVSEMTITAAPWMTVTNPKVAAIPKISPEVNFEDLLARRVDVAFYAYDLAQTRAKLDAIGVAGLVSQPPDDRVATADGYVGQYKEAVRLFGRVLGGEAERQAEAWCAWVDERLRRVTAITAAIPPERRLKLYYLRGPDALSTQGVGSATYWFGSLAGADMVVKNRFGRGRISLEDIARLNPDVIVVGRQYSVDLVLHDPAWAQVSAVKSGRVYPMPEGVFYWDGGVESILLVEFFAKQLYPEQFSELDLAAEVKDFYRRFYRYPLSDDEARLLLAGRSPDGSRNNPMNN